MEMSPFHPFERHMPMFKMTRVVEVEYRTLLPRNDLPGLPHLIALEKGILGIMIVIPRINKSLRKIEDKR